MTIPKLQIIQQELERRRKLEAIKAAKQTPEGGILDSIVEPAKTIATGMAASVGGGLSGMGAEMFGGDGVEMIRSFQRQISQPQTQSGQRSLERLGDLAQFGIDAVNIPISGIAGLMELFSGNGLNQAVNTINSVQNNGAGVTAGERVLDATGSPLAATAARITPEGLAEVIGLKGMGKAVRQAPRAGQAVVNTAQNVDDVAGRLFTNLSPTKRDIARRLLEGSTDSDLAGFRLADDAADQGSALLPRVVRDGVESEAIRQGFDEGVIAALKGASRTDKDKMLRMVDIMEQSKKNNRFSMVNRASDVAGESVMERFGFVLDKNREAAKSLDDVAKSLKGQYVDVDAPVNQFLNDLDSIGVTLDGSLKPIFRGSDVEGLQAPMNVIDRVVARMRDVDNLDAFEVHRLKRYIDENVTFGKSGEGLSGRTEYILKKLRHNLDGVLDQNFQAYNDVNTVYAETIGAIDSLQDVAGRKMDLSGPNAEKAVGTLTRRLLSNVQSRVNLLDSINELEDIGTRYGANFDDDVLTQVLFVDELDSVFGTTARTSFQGQISQAIPTTQGELINRVLNSSIEGLRGVNESAAFNSIRNLLRR